MNEIEVLPEHSPIGGSVIERVFNCPPSVQLSAGVPNSSSPEAAEGTKAHGVGAAWLHDGEFQQTLADPVTPEMHGHVAKYVEAVLEDVNSCGHDVELLVEERLHAPQIHKYAWGTPDAAVYCPTCRRLSVFDFKYGSGLVVEVRKEDDDGNPVINFQLRYYAMLALVVKKWSPVTVRLVIVQPRAYHKDGPVRDVNVSLVELLDFRQRVEEIAILAHSENPGNFKSGAHCRWCPGSYKCPEQEATATALVVRAQGEGFIAPTALGPEELSANLAVAEVVENYIRSLRAHAYREAEAGRPPPGYKLVARRATRKWCADESAIVRILDQEFGLENHEVFDRSLKSPAQIEQSLNAAEKRLFKEMPLTVAISSGNKLVPTREQGEPPLLPGSEFLPPSK